MKQKYHPHTLKPWPLRRAAVLIFVIGFGVVGLTMLAFGSAATNYSPVGFADSCTLENNKTVIYGWGADSSAEARSNSKPDVRVSVGNQTYTVPTDRAGYRDTPINSFLKTYGYEPSSIYGFRAEFSNLYKGSAPAISGILLNAGGSNDGGSNQGLMINTSSSVDNSGLPYFAGGRVPDACLANAPLPAPSPNPAPAPSPIATNPAPKPAPQTPTPSTPPSTTNNTNTANPVLNEFTAVFTLTESGKPLAGIVTTIISLDRKATTDERGVVTFSGVAAGDYQLSFDYAGRVYDYPFVLGSSSDSNPVVPFSVDISEITPDEIGAKVTEAPEANKKMNPLYLVLGALLLVGSLVFVIRRRKRQNRKTKYYPVDMPSMPRPAPLPTQNEKSREELDNLVGVSLKEMVLKSMQEEAERRKTQRRD